MGWAITSTQAPLRSGPVWFNKLCSLVIVQCPSDGSMSPRVTGLRADAGSAIKRAGPAVTRTCDDLHAPCRAARLCLPPPPHRLSLLM